MERQIQMAAKLYECRDAARTLLGPRFPAVMAEYGALVRELAAADKAELMPTAIKICKGADVDAHTQILVFAAAVELMEPSANAS